MIPMGGFFQAHWRPVTLGVAALTIGLYLGMARAIAGEFGFPLDDGWIHQTYARNLATLGEWAYVPGVQSAGSTAPLWTLLLSVAHLLPGDFRFWTYAFGVTGWLGTAWMAGRLSTAAFGNPWLARATVLVVLVEWHLGWAALSGMEIPLYTLLATFLWASYVENRLDQEPSGQGWLPFGWGLVSAALILTRPEGLWLVGLIGLHQLLQGQRLGLVTVVSRLLLLGAGLALGLIPYALYNSYTVGTIFPSTFYAKQREYAILVESIPVWERLWDQFWLPWIGGQVVLLAGLLFGLGRLAWQMWQRSFRFTPWPDGRRWLPLIWVAGLVVVYALRLPVTYQYGRYLMPTIPILLVYGLWGFWELHRVLPRLMGLTLTLIVATLFIIFWLQGAARYGNDTALINCEMVETARWLATHSDPTDLIAAHDIGAIGFVAQRPLLDLAGLVTPETIPILRDEGGLLALMEQRGVRYIITFPDWYTQIPKAPGVSLVYQRACQQSAAVGQPSMAVYITEWGER